MSERFIHITIRGGVCWTNRQCVGDVEAAEVQSKRKAGAWEFEMGGCTLMDRQRAVSTPTMCKLSAVVFSHLVSLC